MGVLEARKAFLVILALGLGGLLRLSSQNVLLVFSLRRC
jgi:hypothetical protein